MNAHIYKTLHESWFKFLGLALAYFGGLFWLTSSMDITQYSVTFFVYSVALFVEYFLKLTSLVRFGKIKPLLIILCGTLILFDSVSRWRDPGMGLLSIDFLNILALTPIIIVFIDTLFITMTEKNEKVVYKPEDKLLLCRER